MMQIIFELRCLGRFSRRRRGGW